MKLSDLQMLAEGRDAPLYHGTDPFSAELILKSNKLIAARVVHAHKNQEGKYVSFSRSLRYANERPDEFDEGESSVVFEIDQRLLAARYKLSPHHDQSDKGMSRRMERSGNKKRMRNEYEERTTTDVVNLDRYITKIIIMSDDSYEDAMRFELIAKHPKLFYNGKFVNAK